MSWHLTLTCDGNRTGDGRGQPCRGTLHTRATSKGDAVSEALSAGWRLPFAGPHLCPSPGHLEET